jgi:hypothetical protein
VTQTALNASSVSGEVMVGQPGQPRPRDECVQEEDNQVGGSERRLVIRGRMLRSGNQSCRRCAEVKNGIV